MRLFWFASFFAVIFSCPAQKYDYTWLTGYDSFGGYDSSAQYHFGISKFNFNQQPMQVSYDSLGIGFSGANAEISDDNGNLLFCTNGVSIRNKFDQIMENGDSLNNGYYLNHLPLWYSEGDPDFALLQVLPNPTNNNLYDVFYIFVDTDYAFNPIGKQLQRAQIDINGNQGLGMINYKNKAVTEITLAPSLSCVKHANGRDWWICTMQEGISCYNVMLYDGSEVINNHVQQPGGFIYHRPETSFLRFSPDGHWLMSADNEQGFADFFEFDRCAGTLSLKEQVYLPELVDSGQLYSITSGEYSPNSRFGYVCASAKLYQFDMEATSIASSKTTVGIYKPGSGPAPLTYSFAQLAPDGKIYIGSGNTTYFIAVVNSPDSLESLCDFRDPGMQLPAFIDGLPYFPNYRLGPIYGSPCDSLTELQTVSNEQTIKIFPNPAEDYAIVDYGFTNWNKGEMRLEIINALGQMIYTQSLPTYSGFQKINVNHFASGMYSVFIKRNNEVVATQKLVKQ